MNKQNITKWGIIGCGNIAKKFADDLGTVPHAELYAVASRSFDKANIFAQEYDATRAYDSYTDLAQDANVDVVYVATPHSSHYENTMLCLDNGKAVLCEKPFAMDSAQVDKMIAFAKGKKAFLMEALWTHFLPHYQYVIEIVNQKKFGDIQELHADFGFVAGCEPEHRLLNKALGGGSLLDLGIYPIFAAMTLLGLPEEIEAKARLSDTGIDHESRMEFRYNNDVTAYLHSSLIETTPTELKVMCTGGQVIVRRPFHAPTTVSLIDNSGGEEVMAFTESTHGYRHEAIHVQDMLNQGRIESTIMTFEKSRKLMSLLDAVRYRIGLHYDS